MLPARKLVIAQFCISVMSGLTGVRERKRFIQVQITYIQSHQSVIKDSPKYFFLRIAIMILGQFKCSLSGLCQIRPECIHKAE